MREHTEIQLLVIINYLMRVKNHDGSLRRRFENNGRKCCKIFGRRGMERIHYQEARMKKKRCIRNQIVEGNRVEWKVAL
jgi:uncharacterized protein YkuJ